MRSLLPYLVCVVSLALAQTSRVPSSPNWFPDQAAPLKLVVDQAFETAHGRTGAQPPRKGLLGLVVPHAALAYSGSVAAAAYERLDHPKNIIVLAFSHSRRLDGVVAPALDSYTTPLGQIRVNREVVRALGFRTEANAVLADHSLENQLPLIQRAAPDAGLIPLYVGDLNQQELADVAGKLVARLKQGDVIVASSDLTHYGAAYQYTPFPVDTETPLRLRNRALELFERIGSLDTGQFERYVAETHDNLCGWAPIRLLMATLARWSEEVYLSPLDYLASGELTNDYHLSVGYGALAFYPASSFAVPSEDQARLLASARRTLDAYTGTRQKTPEPVAAAERDSDLAQRSGVFVTVKKDGELRGCIGTFAPRRPLAEEVAGRTLAAASEDPRFPAVGVQDGAMSLEISVLTPLKRLGSWRDFRPGHGAIIQLDGKSGTLLPQVAREMGWNREEFLRNLALKAGLPPNAYRDPRATLFVYSAQVFAEPQKPEPVHAAGGGR